MRIIYNEDLNKRIIPYVDKLIKNKKSWIKKRLFSSMYSFNILTWIPLRDVWRAIGALYHRNHPRGKYQECRPSF